MSADEINGRYERIRRRVTGGGPGGGDGLVVLRREGLHAWIARAVASSPRRPAPPDVSVAVERSRLAIDADRAPLVSVCTDMLLATLLTLEAR